MGYKEWIQLKIVNKTDRTLVVKDLYLHWGKLYEYPEKGIEVGLDTANSKEIKPGKFLTFASCGRENATHGTEGDLNLFDGDERVMKVYWDSPYWGVNKFSTYYVAEGWHPSNTRWSPTGEFGPVTLTLFKE